MSAKKTNFISGACFGYYDQDFEQCLKCKYKNSCNIATNCKQSDQVRKIFKTKKQIVQKLFLKYKQV